MTRFRYLVRPLVIIGALAAAAVAIALATGRSASVGLYVAGALLCLVALSARGTNVIGVYGEYASTDGLRRSNATRAAYLFSGLSLIALGVLVEVLAG